MQRSSHASERVLDGRYELDAVIGRGGMGEVWAAIDTRLARPVAVKILSPHLAEQPEARQRFEYEASSAAGLAHPNIVTVFDCGEDDGVPYLVMERLPGSTLADELRGGPLVPSRAIEVACEVLGGLQCAHRAGVVHRDVKPGNVLMTEEGHAKVADFGIAKAIEGADATMTVELLATPYYLAPERIRGLPASPATDLFAVGVVMYELLSGERPFTADSPLGVVRAIEANEFVPLRTRRPDLPPSLTDAIDRAMAAEPSDRFVDADEMAAAIERAAAPPPPTVDAATQEPTLPIATASVPSRTEVLPPSAGPGRSRATPATTPSAPLDPHDPHDPHDLRAQGATRRKRPRAALLTGLIAMILVLVAVAVALALALDDGGTSSPDEPAPEVVPLEPGPGAPLPEPLERVLRDLERMVQP